MCAQSISKTAKGQLPTTKIKYQTKTCRKHRKKILVKKIPPKRICRTCSPERAENSTNAKDKA